LNDAQDFINSLRVQFFLKFLDLLGYTIQLLCVFFFVSVQLRELVLKAPLSVNGECVFP
jgi:hypothetical protein